MNAPLQVLNKLVGFWESQVTVNSPDGEMTYTSHTRFEWVLGGQFLQDTGDSPDSDNQHIGLWNYDPQSEVYRSWYFLHPAAAAMQFTHNWDEAAQQMTGSCELGNGLVLNTIDQFKGDDAYEWTATMVNEAEEVITEMKGDCRRVE